MKRIISLVLVVISLISISTVSFCAESTETLTIGDFVAEKIGDGKIKITGYNGKSEELTIPAELDGFKVTAIADNAFKNNTVIRTLTISEGIEEIGDYAFAYCHGLESVTLPESLKSVGEGGFYYCPQMYTVSVPASVEHIGKEAFGYNYRKFDLETKSYVYSVTNVFVMYASSGCAAYEYALSNRILLNVVHDTEFDEYFDCWFEIPPEWVDAKEIYCYIREIAEEGVEITKWQSEQSKMHISNDGSAAFTSYITDRISYGTVCEVIFSTDTGQQTYPAIFHYPNGSYFYCNGKYAVSDNVKVPSLVGTWCDGRDTDAELAEYFGLNKGYKEVKPEDYTPPFEDDDTSWLQYVSEDILMHGDVNCDGKVNVRDATEVQKYLAFFDGMEIGFTGEMLMDVYRDSCYNIKIATQIQKYAAKFETDSYVGEPAVYKVYITSNMVIEEELTFEYTEKYSDFTGKGKLYDDPERKNIRFFYVPVYADEVYVCAGENCRGVVSYDFNTDTTTDGVFNELLCIEKISEDGTMYIYAKNPLN
ncbi:MAG: leucine-rich repeat protein [Clostridia bacterium]|nr:leucine-rich repeat protein [Clostridia bacterium]